MLRTASQAVATPHFVIKLYELNTWQIPAKHNRRQKGLFFKLRPQQKTLTKQKKNSTKPF